MLHAREIGDVHVHARSYGRLRAPPSVRIGAKGPPSSGGTGLSRSGRIRFQAQPSRFGRGESSTSAAAVGGPNGMPLGFWRRSSRSSRARRPDGGRNAVPAWRRSWRSRSRRSGEDGAFLRRVGRPSGEIALVVAAVILSSINSYLLEKQTETAGGRSREGATSAQRARKLNSRPGCWCAHAR